MKYLIKMIVAIFLLLIPEAGTQAFQNEPNGFRDMYWGESLQEIEENRECKYGYYDKNTNSVFYYVTLRDNEEHTLSGNHISDNQIKARLWNNQLVAVYIWFWSPTIEHADSLYNNLLSAASINYGTPNSGHGIWEGETTEIEIFKYKNALPYGVAVIMSSRELSMKALTETASQGW